ncbi:hypothetical protein SAY87_008007 [Trapa incisa]|uniref:Bromo domain-containing protein n=1 Tax=Trapa incisa TaxID=236973 RepID=A0AAN7KG52_9MYRT|nr:hypothetical protein SAY87_008007 [Trapa incisa]
MNRKRSQKKGKSKGAKKARVGEASKPAATQNTENYSSDDEVVQNEPESGMEVNTPSSSGTDQSHNVANINPDDTVEKTSSKPMARVKVKLKTSKVIDVDMMEDSTDSLPEVKADSLENPSKKAASIKIKTPKTLSSVINQTGNAAGGEVESDQQKEQKDPVRNTQFNKQELDSALLVIRKVMKMDAAEPFNVPVDPIALGIPDYFDVIDTPMDFGTICTDLEKGVKYKNSEDVFKDVQYIWGNCYKYNNKGDYILDLMRRVKKNFMKYWTAAGLSTGSDSNQEDASSKSGSKPKGKKRHGFRRHKSDCLCAICMMMRKRKEREEKERIARGLIAEELKQEVPSNLGSPYGEVSSSNSDDSQDNDGDDDMEEKREELISGHPQQQQQQKQSPWNGKDDDEDNKGEDDEMDTGRNDEIPSQTPDESERMDDLGAEGSTGQKMKRAEFSGVQESGQKEFALEQLEEKALAQQGNMKEARERDQRAQMYQSQNPALLSLCRTLFPENPNSVWNGPGSLVPQRRPAQPGSIFTAIESFMK